MKLLLFFKKDQTSKALSDILASLNPNSFEENNFFQPVEEAQATKKQATIEDIYNPPKSASSSKSHKYSASKRIQPAKYKRKPRSRQKQSTTTNDEKTENMIIVEEPAAASVNVLSSILADLDPNFDIIETENPGNDKLDDFTEKANQLIVPLNLHDSKPDKKVIEADIELTELDSIPAETETKIESNKKKNKYDPRYRKNSHIEKFHYEESNKNSQAESINKTYNPKSLPPRTSIPSTRVPTSISRPVLSQRIHKSKSTLTSVISPKIPSIIPDVSTSNLEPLEKPKSACSSEAPPNPTTTSFELSTTPRSSRAVISFYCTSEFG